MQAGILCSEAINYIDTEQLLKVHLDGAELANRDGIVKGKVDDFLVAQLDPDDDDGEIVVMAWSDLAGKLQSGSAGDAASVQLAQLGIDQNAINVGIAKKAVHSARLRAVQEFRRALTDPSAAYPEVPVEGFSAPPIAETIPPPPQASAASTAAQSEWQTMTPTEAAQKFIEHNPRTGGHNGNARKAGKSWCEKTRQQFQLPALLLEQIMPNRPLASITHADLLVLNDHFNRLHGPSFRKSPRQRDKTISQIADETDALVTDGKINAGEIGLGLVTTNRHWGFLKQLTEWFAMHQPLAALNYKALFIVDDRDERDQRDVYTNEEGAQIFALPPWRGCKSTKRRMQNGSLIIHDAYYYVPIIAWYSGLRRDEICGLELADIGQDENGIWFLDIVQNDTRGLKNKKSRRMLPIGTELQRLGFIDYVNALKADGETLLFPELAPESKIGTLGDAYYKIAWSKMREKLPFLEWGQATHAFRHTAIDAMKEAGIPEEVRADFAGHSLVGETAGRYSKRTRLPTLLNAIETIPKVTADIEAIPLNLLPRALRRPRKARVKKVPS